MLWWGLNSFAVILAAQKHSRTFVPRQKLSEDAGILRNLWVILLLSLFGSKSPRLTRKHDLTVFKSLYDVSAWRPHPPVAQLGMSSCSITGENKGLWGECARNPLQLVNRSVCELNGAVIISVLFVVRLRPEARYFTQTHKRQVE